MFRNQIHSLVFVSRGRSPVALRPSEWRWHQRRRWFTCRTSWTPPATCWPAVRPSAAAPRSCSAERYMEPHPHCVLFWLRWRESCNRSAASNKRPFSKWISCRTRWATWKQLSPGAPLQQVSVTHTSARDRRWDRRYSCPSGHWTVHSVPSRISPFASNNSSRHFTPRSISLSLCCITGQSRTYYTLSLSRLSTRSPSAGAVPTAESHSSLHLRAVKW